MQNPKKIHVVTKVYLEGWSSGGVVRPISVLYGRQKLKTCAAVGWRREWWGTNDPVLNRVCEEACGKLEAVLPDALAAVESEWPLGLVTRSVLAQFLALHIVRTPSFPDWFAPVRDDSIAQYRDHFPSRKKYERWRSAMQSDRERAKKLLSLINKLSTVLGSMHWTLLRFDEPLLMTADQPVSPVPLLTPGVAEPIAVFPRNGWLDTCEIRCPLTPWCALLATWYMGPSTEPIAGTWAQAVNFNASVAAQAVEQRFQTPDREPAMPPAIFREPLRLLSPVSLQVLPGYTMDAATHSPLRAQTAKALEALIERRDHKTITVITPDASEERDHSGVNVSAGFA